MSSASASLLFEVGLDGIAAIVPDLGRGGEADRIAEILQSPDDVDIVAGLAILRIKAVDLLECPGVEGHVAAGHMLGCAVIDHDVRRPAGR